MFTQDELKQATKQMNDAQAKDRIFGRMAAKHLGCKSASCDNVNPYGGGFQPYDIAEQILIIQLSEYDNWQGTIDQLTKKGVVYKNKWNGTYKNAPIGILDLTNDPDFADARQKVFKVKLNYYNAHWSGF